MFSIYDESTEVDLRTLLSGPYDLPVMSLLKDMKLRLKTDDYSKLYFLLFHYNSNVQNISSNLE